MVRFQQTKIPVKIFIKRFTFFFRCVVWTGDGRVFFYNPSTRTSLWERPPELTNRPDVDKAIKTLPEALLTPQNPSETTNKEESTTPQKPPPKELVKQGKKRSDSESSNESVEAVNTSMTKKIKLNGELLFSFEIPIMT